MGGIRHKKINKTDDRRRLYIIYIYIPITALNFVPITRTNDRDDDVAIPSGIINIKLNTV